MEKTKEELPEQYFEREYGKGHIEKVIELNDMISLYGLMEEYGKLQYSKGFESCREKVEEGVDKACVYYMEKAGGRYVLDREEVLIAIKSIKE